MSLHTLHIEHVYLLAVCTLLTTVNVRLQRGLAGRHFFTLYNALLLCGAVAVALRGMIPEFASIVVGDFCVMGGYFALLTSMHRMFRFNRRNFALAGACLGVGLFAMIQFGSITPDTKLRLLAYSVVLCVQQAQIGLLLVWGDAERRRVSWMLGATLLTLAAANIVRIATLSVQGAPQDYLQSGPALYNIVLVTTALQCGVVIAYIWMTAALLRRDLEQQATTDPLTGLLNRRALELAATREMETTRAGLQPASIILLDLDEYKRINDNLGHAAGDQTLIAVARCLRCHLRAGDLLARSGGDEFVALLPRTNEAGAKHLAGVLRACVAELDLGLSDPNLRITASFGVAEASPGEPWDRLLKGCDTALYAVKRQGGNGVLTRSAESAPEMAAMAIPELRVF